MDFTLKPNRWLSFSYLVSLLIVLGCASNQQEAFSQSPVSHQLWDELLQQHVKPNGLVDYRGFMADRAQLTQYLNLLKTHHPHDGWTEAEQLAYWINAYNAITVNLICQHYPVESIKDIGTRLQIPLVYTVWTQTKFTIEGKTYSLDDIEHQILRKQFEEPRIHFAINCASISCPDLRAEAFTAEKLEPQLTEQTKAFLQDGSKNRLAEEPVQLSRIFKWFQGDFTKKGSLVDFLNRYSDTPVSSGAVIEYLPYDWQLNEAAQ